MAAGGELDVKERRCFRMKGNSLLLALILWPVVAALFCYFFGRFREKVRNWTVLISVTVEFLLAIAVAVSWRTDSNIIFALPEFGISGMNLEVDGFRMVFCVLTAFLWLGAGIFSIEYMKHESNCGRFYLFFLLTLSATEGVFLSADLMTTFVFFEIMSFTSYVWVVQEETKEALAAGATYLTIAVVSGLVLLMGLFLLYSETGTLQIRELLEASRMAAHPELISVAGFCLLVGFGAKAGMFPLHIWLPKAHPVAPAPASALLSGILTKAGIFGIFITASQIFWKDTVWGTAVLLLGTATMVLGGLYALFSTNLKRILACSSMSQLGFILVGVGMSVILGEENGIAVRGALLHTLNHPILKLVLFLSAGVVAMNLNELDLNKIRGFGRKKPLLKIAFLTGALGISGIPLFNGYLSKTLLHESIVEGIAHAGADAGIYHLIEVLFLFSGGLTVAYMLKLYIAIFVEKNKESEFVEASDHNYIGTASAATLVFPAVLISVLGILPYVITDRIVDWMQGFMNLKEHIQISYFSFQNLKGSFVSIGIGIILYFGFVRTVLMRRDSEGESYYIRPISGLDLEEGIYRPVLFVLLPTLGGMICRFLDRLLDNIILLLRKTLYRHTKPKKKLNATKEAYIIGLTLDELARMLNKTILRKHPIQRKSFVGIVEVGEKTVGQTGRLIARSVSFGLLLFSIGLLITLFYLLFFV